MMTSSLHHGNMDHLEHQDEHELQMNLSKELLRSGIASVESSAIQFIASAPVGNHTREQEYIESSLLGTDLLSSHLPTHTLNDYITSVPCSSTSSLNSLQPTMLEHHYRTFLSDDLQSLVEVSGIQPSSDPADRKLFQQYGNKSSSTLGSSNETAVIVTGSKEIPSFGTITTYDKLLNMAQPPSPIPGGLVQISGAIDGYVHFAPPACETYDMIGSSITTSHHHQEQHDIHNPYGLHHLHHHTQHHHHQQQQQHTQNAKELPVMVNTSIALGPTFIPCSQSSLQPSDANTMKLLSNTIIPVTTMAEPTHIHDGTTLTISPLRSQPEHSKSYYSSPHLTSFLTNNKERSNVTLVDATVLNDIGSEVSDAEARIEEADTDCLTSMDIASQTMPLAPQESINLPHKKRLSKKLGDTKEASSSGESIQPTSVSNETRVTVIASESTVMSDDASQQPSILQSGRIQPDDSHTTKSNESLPRQEPATIVCFSCQLCGQLFQDQLLFFTHLKTHYEPEIVGPKKDTAAGKGITVNSSNDLAESIDASQLEGKKPKPKLPRVKHTKMLKTDRMFKDSTAGVPTQQNCEGENSVTSSQIQTKPLLSCTQSASINSNGIELDSGEFSDTEDMLEGIRNVVQQTVDKDPTEESCFNIEPKQWFTSSVTENAEGISEKEKMLVPSTVEGTATLQSRNASTNQSASASSFDMLFNKSQLDKGGLVETLETTDYQSLQTTPVVELQQSNKCDFQLEPIGAKWLMNNGVKTVATDSPAFLAYTQSLMPSMEQITESFSKIQEVVSNHTDPSQVASIRCIPLPNLRNSVESQDEGSAEHTQSMYTSATPAGDGEEEQTAISMDAPLDDAMEEDGYEDGECDSEELDNLSATEPEPVLDQTEDNVKQSNKRSTKGKRKSRKVQPGGKSGTTGNNQSKSTKYLCQVDGCGRQFNSNTAFQYHRLQHTGERPYKCAVCGKCFITCSALKVHERLHSGEKPYKCDQCGHCFRQWGDLKYHKISIHSNEKSHKCEFCGKQFARRYSLSLHRRIHTNEKNFICEYCNKAFRASTYLQTHRRIHTGEKPHQCTICNKKFRCHGDINRHLKTHERTKDKGKQQAQPIADTDGAPKVSQTQKRSNVIDLTKSKPKRAKKTAAKATALE